MGLFSHSVYAQTNHQNDANINQTKSNPKLISDLFVAIKRENINNIQSLLKQNVDPNSVNEKGVPALLWAIQGESWKSVSALLLSPKINIEARNEQGESALMLVALKGRTELIQPLIDKDADINKTGWTALHYASSGTSDNQAAIVQLLLDNHAYIDAESPNKTTPLMMAAKYGREDVVKLLLEAGADVTLRNQQNLSALQFAQQSQRESVVQMINNAQRERKPKGSW